MRMWRKESPPEFLVGKWIGAATMENNREASQKVKNEITIWSKNYSTSGHLSEENKTKEKKLHIYCSITYNRQGVEKLKGTQMEESIDILQYYSTKKIMDSSHLRQHEWTLGELCSCEIKSDRKRQIPHNVTYM